MNWDFLILSRRICHEYQRFFGSRDTHSRNTQRVHRTVAPCGSISTAACCWNSMAAASPPIAEFEFIVNSDGRRGKNTRHLLADLGVTRSQNRPHTSNDNPFSESHFKTLKYQPRFPQRFGCIKDAGASSRCAGGTGDGSKCHVRRGRHGDLRRCRDQHCATHYRDDECRLSVFAQELRIT